MAFDKRKALQSALTFTQQGKWDRAIAEYQAILKADPHDLTVCNNLGDLYARAGKAAEAIEQYLKLGELYRADGLSVKAIAVYKKIIKLDPNRTQALVACADLYEEQGLTGEAKLQLLTVAEQYARAGDAPKLIEVYQRLTALDPANHTLLTKLADLLAKEGRREEAAAQYELAAEAAEAAGKAAECKRLLAKVRELAPESPQANLAAGEQFLREGRHVEAVDALLKATAGETSAAKAWRLLGEAYVGLGQSSEAITALEQAVGLGIPQTEVRRPLAKALILEGQTDEGLTLCQQLSEEALGRNNPEEAIATCRDLLAVAPHLAPIHAYLVRLLQDLGRDKEAREATRDLAAAHEACGETEAAIHVYHQLLEGDPSDAEARARLEALEGTPAPSVEQEISLPDLEAGRAALAPEEASAPELSLEDALATGGAATLQTGEGVGREGPSAPVFELDESGELMGIRHPVHEGRSAGLQDIPGLGGPGIELPAEGGEEDLSELVAAGEDEVPAEAAERLAEAEVYLKYGLMDKARERLLEVIRVAPNHLAAHRQLKALYLERPEIEEVCNEILAIAQILEARGLQAAAVRELREGLKLAPDHPALRRSLAELSAAQAPALEGAGVTPGAGVPDVGLGEAPGGDAPPIRQEELPPELRVLLEEEPGEEPALVVEEGEADVEQAMAEDLTEAQFYLSQGMLEEARAVHLRMRARDASHPTVARLADQLGEQAAAVAAGPAEPEGPEAGTSSAGPQAAGSMDVLDFLPEMPPESAPQQKPTPPARAEEGPPPAMAVPKFSVMQGGGEAGSEGFVNLGAEIQDELAAEEREGSRPAGGPLVEELLREFQKGVREHLDEKDFETHYNLGIAYKEMELYDEAIQEFRLAARDRGRALACADLLGLCYLAKGDAQAAIREFRAGLQILGHPRESYQSLRYDLGIAYETHGNPERALETFEALRAEAPQFRDVAARVEALRERIQRTQVASLPASPLQAGDAVKRGRDKKISFI